LDRAKALGVTVLGFALFVLYLALANWFFSLNISSLPLGATITDFVIPLVLIDVAIVNLYVVYRRRQVPGTK